MPKGVEQELCTCVDAQRLKLPSVAKKIPVPKDELLGYIPSHVHRQSKRPKKKKSK
ncbi:MAG: hypothetical protein NT003_03900 [Candidatus Magasanikbacteria bacterium]|nr:hypothetical protein [Candidatus Magasanikbacteria bacterium]